MKNTQYIIIILFALAILFIGGTLIALTLSHTSTSGGISIDTTPLFSLVGLLLIALGIQILSKKFHKYSIFLHRSVFSFGIILCLSCIFVYYYSAKKIELQFGGIVDVLPPNGFSIIVAIVAVIGLLSYPFIKEQL